MRRSAVVLASLIVVFFGPWLAPLFADEASERKLAIEEVRKGLDAVDASAKSLKKGQTKATNDLLHKIGVERKKLYGWKDKSIAEWAELVRRSWDLDDQVREAGTGKKPAPAEADDDTKQALALLDATQKDLDAGDTAKLGKQLDEARAHLLKAKEQRAKEWVESFARVDLYGKTVQKRAAEAAKPAEKPPEKPPEPIGPVVLEAGKRPPKATTPMKGRGAYDLNRSFYRPLDRSIDELATKDPADFAGENSQKAWRDLLESMQLGIDACDPQDHPELAWCRAYLAELRKQYAAKLAEGTKKAAAAAAAAASEKKDVEGRVAELESFFGDKFTCLLAPPFTPERARDWAVQLKSLEAGTAKGKAEVEKLVQEHPKYKDDARVRHLQGVFGGWLQQRIQQDKDVTLTREWDGIIANGKMFTNADWSTPEKLLDDENVARATKGLREGIVATRARAAFLKEYDGHDGEMVALAKELEVTLEKFETGAKKALENARMPAAASKDAELLAAAKKVLADHPDLAGPYERMVVSSLKERHKERRSSSHVVGEYLEIHSWTAEWDDFQVAVAEKVGDDYWVVYYTIAYATQGRSDDPLNRWYCSERQPWNRILKENIDK